MVSQEGEGNEGIGGFYWSSITNAIMNEEAVSQNCIAIGTLAAVPFNPHTLLASKTSKRVAECLCNGSNRPT